MIKDSAGLACHIMSQTERYLNFNNNRYAKNEFKAGDFIQFGRITYHVRETSSEPILVSENNADEEINKSNKSLDNTNAEALNFYSSMGMDPNATLRASQNLLDPSSAQRPRSENSPRTPTYLQAPHALLRVRSRISGTNLTFKQEGQSDKSKEDEKEDKETFTCRI